MLNPPSGVTAANYWAAIKAGKPTHVRITFLGQDIVLTDEDIDVSTGITISDVLNSDTDLVFGKAVCKQVSMQILNSSNLTGLVWTGEFTLEFGVEMGTPGVTQWVTVGTFAGDKPKNVTTAQTIAFDAYDRMKKFDILADDFVKGITYPATLSTIYSNLCSFVGVSKVGGNELANIMSRSFASAPAEMEGYTCRDLLAWIAEAAGCYAKINAAGNCQMVWFTDNTSHTVSADEEFSVETGDVYAGLTWDEADTYTWDEIGAMTWNDVCGYEEAYSIDQIQVKQLDNDLDINYPYPYGGNVYMIVDNPFLQIGSAAQITSYIKPIYDRLVAFGGYLPVGISCIGSWCVEAGDMITISVQGNSITFPIFVKTMRWNGAIVDEYETTGQKDRAVYTSDKNKQKVLTNKEIKLYVDGNFYGVISGIEIIEDGVKISGGKFIQIRSGGSFTVESGNFTIDQNGSVTIKTNLALGGSGNSGGTLTIYDANGNQIGKWDKDGISALSGTFSGQLSSPTGNLGGFTINGNKLEAGVLKLDADNKEVVAGNWYFGQAGLSFNNPSEPLSLPFVLNNFNVGLETGKVGMYIRQQYWDSNYVNQLFFALPEPVSGSTEHYVWMIQASKTSSSKTFILYADVPSGVDSGIGAPTAHITHIYADNVHYGTLSQFSSREVKHDVKPLKPMGEKIDKLAPVTFVYDDDDTGTERMGLIYEETVKVMPEICLKDSHDNKAINYVELIPALLKEIQDLRRRVKELEGRI